jgi:putative hemolysin
MDGRLPLHEMLTVLGLDLELDDQPNASTVAGMVLDQLGRIPNRGEHTDWMGWRFEVVDMDGARIDQVLVTRNFK